MQHFIHRHAFSLLFLSAALLAVRTPAKASTVLSNTLSSTSSGADTVTGSELLAADFTTDASSYSLTSATLSLQSDSTGTATLALYSDNSGIPGSLLGTLTSPSSYTSSLSNTTFTASGITLSADTTYWLVLQAASGAYEWSWTADNNGSGTGYLGDSAYNDGTYWYPTSGVYPYQASVSADTLSSSAVPEPQSLSLITFAALGGLLLTFGRQALVRRRAIT